MANSIVIEIVANFKDNAMASAKALNAELDKLEKRKVDIDMNSNDKASRIVDDMNSKLDKVDGSKAAQAIDGINAKAEQFANGVTEKTVSVNTSNAERAIDSLQRKIDSVGKTGVSVAPNKESIWVNGAENIRTYGDTIAQYAEEALEEIPRTRRRARSGGSNYYGYDQSAVDFIEKYANSNAGLSNNAEIPANFWTELATQEDKNLYTNSQMSALALAQFGAVNPDTLSAADRAEYNRLTGISQIVGSSVKDIPRVVKISPKYAKYYGYDQEAMDFIENYASGGGSGEGGFWGQISPEIDKNRTVKRMAQMGRMFGSKATTTKGQALAGVGAMTGVAIAGTALVSAGNDFKNAYASDNHNDTERSIYRGFTKGLLTVAGGAVGSIIAPGVGTMIGAGIGGGISDLFGDKLADSISGIHKSAEELKQDRLDEIFGDIAMSATDLTKVFQNMVGTSTMQMRSAHSQALTTGFSLQDQTASSYYSVVENGSKLDIKGNLGFHIPNEDFKSYKEQVSDYMDSIEETMNQEIYNAFMVNDDLFGYGQWDTEGLSDKWKTAFENFAKQKEELSKYLERALGDGNFSPDEREHVFGIIHEMQQTTTELSPDEGQVKQNSYEFLSKNGLLSQDSYNDLLVNMQSDYNNRIYELSTTRSTAVENGMNTEEADKTFWDDMNSSTESYLQSILDSVHNMYNADYSAALSSAWEGKTDAFGINKNGLNQIYEEGSSYQKTLSDASNFDNLYRTDKNGYAAYYRKDSLNRIGEAGDILKKSFDSIDDKTQQALGTAYEGMLPMVKQIEGQVKNTIANGQDPSVYFDELMSMYQIGALGGGEVSREKYTAMLMAGDKTSADAINAIFGNDYDMMAGTMGKDFADMWQLINGSGNSGAEAIQKQAEEEQKALDEAADKTAQVAQDGSEKKKEAIDESGDKVAEATKDNTEKITNATEESVDKITEATQNNESNDTIGTHFSAFDPNLPKYTTFGDVFKGWINSFKISDPMDIEVPIEAKFSAFEPALKRPSNFKEVWQGWIDGFKNPKEKTEILVQVTPKFQVKAGNLNSSFSGLPSVEGTANYELGTSPEEVPDATGVANYTGDFSGIGSAPTRYGSVVYTPTIQGVSSDSPAAKYNFGTWHWANGTDNAPEGAAWVNDDGTSWPYELIEHNGEFRIYEGRNVLTRLEKGDRVYTSSETKDILSGRSIPRYAQGLNNDVIKNIPTVSGGSGSVNVEVGGISVTIQIDGNSKGGNIVEQITSHSTEIAEVITAELERHLSASFANSGGGG